MRRVSSPKVQRIRDLWVLEVEDHGEVVFGEAPFLGEEPARVGYGEVAVVLFEPAT